MCEWHECDDRHVVLFCDTVLPVSLCHCVDLCHCVACDIVLPCDTVLTCVTVLPDTLC